MYPVGIRFQPIQKPLKFSEQVTREYGSCQDAGIKIIMERKFKQADITGATITFTPAPSVTDQAVLTIQHEALSQAELNEIADSELQRRK